MKKMINISANHLNEVIRILRIHLDKNISVFAFGSRVKDTARKFSDLDLVIQSKQEIPKQTLFKLEEDFAESDLPFRIDISDWSRLSDSFKPLIEKDKVRIEF